jgi:hypothetical protein
MHYKTIDAYPAPAKAKSMQSKCHKKDSSGMTFFFILLILSFPSPSVAQTYRVFFGDMHSHSELSWDAAAGAKMPTEAYAYAKNIAKTDFMAISDHTNGLPQVNYEKIRAAAAAYDKFDSQFVAIAGQELGSLGATGYGHMNIFEAPTIAGNGLDNDAIRYDLNMAYQFIIGNRASGQFNHPSVENGNSNFLNFDYVSVAAPYMTSIEVINGTRSTNYERYYLAALQKGWHVGALGDQDNHGANYGNLRSSDGDIYLTGVLADSLTKAKILGAIRSRRTYAFETNPFDDRIYLDTFTADGHWMGEIFNDSDNRVTLRVAARSATNIRFRQAQIYRNGFLLAWQNLDATNFEWTAVDSNSTGPHYYFAKLVQEDGDLLWTSPIWVNSPGANPTESAPMTIRSLRQNFSDGVPQTFGWANVKLRGVATAGTHFGSEGPGYLQDSTGGVAVFGGDFSKTVGTVIGPTTAFEIEVLGGVSQFNGNMEIIPYSVRRINVKPAVAPQVIKTSQLAAGENLEGVLVKIVGARITGGSFPPAGGSANLIIDDGSGPGTMRIDSDTDIDGQATPAGKIDIVGILNQFDSSLPYAEGYQLLPRRVADITPATGVESEHEIALPKSFSLLQNHPNPFVVNGETAIQFVLPAESTVRLEIFNLLGKRVALLVDEKLLTGEHRANWDGRKTGQTLASGIYFYRLQAVTKNAKWMAVKKMVLLP